MENIISFRQNNSGVLTHSVLGKSPVDGVVDSFILDIPEFIRCSYFACSQKYDIVANLVFPDSSNRLQALTVTDFCECKEGGLFCVIEETQGQYLILLPLTGKQTTSWLLGSDNHNLILRCGTLGTADITEDVIPVLSWIRTDNIYWGCFQVWNQIFNHPLIQYSTDLRQNKSFPEVFEYLGWCSWEEFKEEIDEDKILDVIDCIENGDLPIRYILIDDGHLEFEKNGGVASLTSFKADKTKFPNGWKNILARKDKSKIKWMGLWLNFNGYWGGVAKNNELGDLNQHLTELKNGSLMPRNSMCDSFCFYDKMLGCRSQDGFDFLKVDDQAQGLRDYVGSESPVECAVNNSRSLEAASALYFDGLINCMAHGPTCIFNTRKSAVTRCSEDYKVGNLPRAKRHLFNSYANIPFLGQTVWGDHDMFHSSDLISGDIMARSKAISGGPIYISDHPCDFHAEYILPLCWSDGKIIRPLAPAAPIQECIFDDPFISGKAYTVLAPLENGSVALALYNLSEPDMPVSGVVSRDYYKQATNMLQADHQKWEIPDEGLLLYDVKKGTVQILEDSIPCTINEFNDLFYLMIPIQHNWGVIGRTDKYLSSAAVEILHSSSTELILDVKENCEFIVYSNRLKLNCDRASVSRLDNHLWKFEFKNQQDGTIVRIFA